MYNTFDGRTRTQIEWRYIVLILHMNARRQHDVEPSKLRKFSLHASRFRNPRCSHVSKEKRVIEALVSITAVRGTSLAKHRKCVIMTLGSIDLAIVVGWVSPCCYSFPCALGRSVSSEAMWPLNSRCQVVSRASRVRGA